MSKRNKIIIGAAIVLAVLAIIILLLSLGQKEPAVNENANQPAVNKPGLLPLTNINGNVNLPQSIKEAQEQSSLLARAFTFSEKFGSFSNQSGFENLEDLKVMMTPKMINWTNQYIAESLKQQGATDYLGITTKSLSVNINYQTEVAAEVIVATQRSELAAANPRPRVYYQNILLQFVNSDGAWKVDNAVWQ